jgi:hypothetical protein
MLGRLVKQCFVIPVTGLILEMMIMTVHLDNMKIISKNYVLSTLL